MTVFNVQTTNYSEDDLVLCTQLSEKQVRSVISPMLDEEREGDFLYNVGDYIAALRSAYPKSVVLTLDDMVNIKF